MQLNQSKTMLDQDIEDGKNQLTFYTSKEIDLFKSFELH